jgi:glycerol uptake facilitator-like aquaporin
VGFKGLMAATAAVALMTAPTVAAAQSAAQVAPATETVDSGNELRGGFIVPLLAVVAVILGILAATHDDDDDLPTSP